MRSVAHIGVVHDRCGRVQWHGDRVMCLRDFGRRVILKVAPSVFERAAYTGDLFFHGFRGRNIENALSLRVGASNAWGVQGICDMIDWRGFLSVHFRSSLSLLRRRVFISYNRCICQIRKRRRSISIHGAPFFASFGCFFPFTAGVCAGAFAAPLFSSPDSSPSSSSFISMILFFNSALFKRAS